jgi:MFS family permease
MNFLYLLAALAHFSQGISGLVSQPLYYFLRETRHLSVSRIMYLTSITTIPWMLKPVYGFLSDLWPINSYHRKPYIIISALICSTMAFAIGFSPTLTLPLLIVFLFIFSIGQAGDNVAINGFVVEHGNKTNTIGKLQSLQWGSLAVAEVLTGAVGGWLSTKYSYHVSYVLIAIFPATIAVAALFLKEEKAIIKASKLTGIKEFFSSLKNKQLLLASLFLFLFWFSPSIGTPLMDRMRNIGLSKIFIGWIGTIGSIFSIIGAAIYFRVSTKIDMKRWLYYSVIFSTIATFAYLYTTKESLLVYDVIFSISGQFVQLLMLGLMSRTCPKGVEATTFALLTSVVNFGGSMSNIVGGKLFGMFGYDGLVIISGIATFLCLFFIPFLEIGVGVDKQSKT